MRQPKCRLCGAQHGLSEPHQFAEPEKPKVSVSFAAADRPVTILGRDQYGAPVSETVVVTAEVEKAIRATLPEADAVAILAHKRSIKAAQQKRWRDNRKKRGTDAK